MTKVAVPTRVTAHAGAWRTTRITRAQRGARAHAPSAELTRRAKASFATIGVSATVTVRDATVRIGASGACAARTRRAPRAVVIDLTLIVRARQLSRPERTRRTTAIHAVRAVAVCCAREQRRARAARGRITHRINARRMDRRAPSGATRTRCPVPSRRASRVATQTRRTADATATAHHLCLATTAEQTQRDHPSESELCASQAHHSANESKLRTNGKSPRSSTAEPRCAKRNAPCTTESNLPILLEWTAEKGSAAPTQSSIHGRSCSRYALRANGAHQVSAPLPRGPKPSHLSAPTDAFGARRDRSRCQPRFSIRENSGSESLGPSKDFRYAPSRGVNPCRISDKPLRAA